MNRIMVFITLSDSGIETIKSNPELPKKEMEFVNQWKQEMILESFFISVTKKDAVLIFQNIDEARTPFNQFSTTSQSVSITRKILFYRSGSTCEPQ